MANETQEINVEVCAICVDPFNRTVRKKVACNNCQTDICTKCIKRFLAETLQEPNCMQCRELYTNEFLDNNFSIQYRRKVLKNLRETILVEREKPHLPELMHRANACKKTVELREMLTKLGNECAKLMRQSRDIDQYITNTHLSLSSSQDDAFTKVTSESLMLSVQTRTKLQDTITDYINQKDSLYEKYEKYEKIYMHGGMKQINKVIPCAIQGCKGFLNNKSVCGLCATRVCPDCREVVDGDDHVCVQANIDSIKAIEKETRPCPTCHTRIFKTEGCDQMFCMSCHTAFSWDTGRIERGRIHNPHYYEWLRRERTNMPREVGDIPCGGLPLLNQVQTQLDNLQVSIAEYIYVGAIYKMAEYMQEKEMRRYPVTMGRDEELNMAGIHFLAGRITENQWKSKLVQLEKRREINTEKRLILDMLLAVLTDYFRALFDNTHKDQVTTMLDELEELRQYYNNNIDNLKLRFDTYAFKKITKDWSKLVY